MTSKITHIIGIDEAGRGPLAGPVAVGAVLVPVDFDWGLIAGVGDSKKVSPKNREAIFGRAEHLRKQEAIQSAVSLVSAKTIDKIGITAAVRLGISRCLKRFAIDPKHVAVKLDGLLVAPAEFVYQETIIKGDAKEKSIGLASILAKVKRDRYMARIAPQFAPYNFHIHKGYGTKAHCVAIKAHGLCELHRASFCTRLQK